MPSQVHSTPARSRASALLPVQATFAVGQSKDPDQQLISPRCAQTPAIASLAEISKSKLSWTSSCALLDSPICRTVEGSKLRHVPTGKGWPDAREGRLLPHHTRCYQTCNGGVPIHTLIPSAGIPRLGSLLKPPASISAGGY